MNRGHELMLRGDEAGLVDALQAYDEAIVLFRSLPVAENPSWANSFGAALMNRGQLLHRLYGVTLAALALTAFEEAETVLRPLQAGDSPWPRRNFAGTLVNRANLQLDLGHHAAASADASKALLLAAPSERQEMVDADLALKARRALGDAIGQLLVAPGADQETLARQAGDIADDALALIRYWSGQSNPAFHVLALRFFRYGAQLYRFHQPHFLAEFIAENLPPADPEFRAIARETIDAVLTDSRASGRILTIGDPVSERRRQTWQDLDALRSRLTQA